MKARLIISQQHALTNKAKQCDGWDWKQHGQQTEGTYCPLKGTGESYAGNDMPRFGLPSSRRS